MVSSATPASGRGVLGRVVAERGRRDLEEADRAIGAPHGEASVRRLDVRLRRLEEPGRDARAARHDLVGGLRHDDRAEAHRAPGARSPTDAHAIGVPVTSRTCSGSTPSQSARIWAKLVSWPWPADSVPRTSSTRPAGSTVISARSRGAPVFSSM